MNVQDILIEARKTWGNRPMALHHIAIAITAIVGDIARQSRNVTEGAAIDQAALQKELGNLISSSIRWCDDLGFDPRECIKLSQQAQSKYVRARPPQW